MTASSFQVQDLDVAETYELRRRVLRNNDPGATVHIREDDSDAAWHLGAVADGRVVATSSYYAVPYRLRPEFVNATQLRFMAVDPSYQDTGVGKAVIGAAIERIRKQGAGLLWANARDTALGFYLHRGFRTDGPSFVEPTSGLPHTVVLLELT